MKSSSKRGGPARRRLLPRTLRGWLITGTAAALLVAAAVVAAVYLVVFPTSSPAPLTLSSPSSSAAATSAPTTELSGTWKIASGSKAGYRVREQLGGVPALSDAVGRTTAVKGSVTLSDTSGTLSVTAASFDVDVSSLTSDDGRRDNRIRLIGLESDQPAARARVNLKRALEGAAPASGSLPPRAAHVARDARAPSTQR